MTRTRVVFFGSPAFAVASLRAVATGAELVAVVSQPDRPAGRGQAQAAPAVKIAAGELGVPVLQPEKVRTPETAAALAAFGADLFVVVAYGRILPQSLLDMPRLGAYNVHASLLPRLRGAAPIQWSIIRGDSETGVSIMRMEAGLDTGPVAATRRIAIADDDTAGTLSAKLADLGAGLLAETLPAIAEGGVRLIAQEEAAATIAPLLTKADGDLRFDRPAPVVSAQARGVDPWPGGDRDARRRAAEAVPAPRRRRVGPARRGAGAARGRSGDRVRRGRDRIRRAPAPRAETPAGRVGVARATRSPRARS